LFFLGIFNFLKQKGEILSFKIFLVQIQLILLLFWDKFTNFFDITKLKNNPIREIKYPTFLADELSIFACLFKLPDEK
jgi:hypothetical protein